MRVTFSNGEVTLQLIQSGSVRLTEAELARPPLIRQAAVATPDGRADLPLEASALEAWFKAVS